MSQKNCFLVLCLIFSFAVLLKAQSRAKRNQSLCYHFTWLGPRWDNESIFLNASCLDATKQNKRVPCVEPLVVSLNGTWPDLSYVWRHHAGNATCKLARNDVCAQHTYYFNGEVDNSTYLCTRAVNEFGEAITSGCFEHRKGSFLTRTCFCKSVPGGLPCNKAVIANVNVILIIFTGFFLFVILFSFMQVL